MQVFVLKIWEKLAWAAGELVWIPSWVVNIGECLANFQVTTLADHTTSDSKCCKAFAKFAGHNAIQNQCHKEPAWTSSLTLTLTLRKWDAPSQIHTPSTADTGPCFNIKISAILPTQHSYYERQSFHDLISINVLRWHLYINRTLVTI